MNSNSTELEQVVKAIFVWPWNENARAKQKQQTNRNRAIWLVYRTDTNAHGFWLAKWTLGWKNVMCENFLEINRYFALKSYCNTIGQSNNAFSILRVSLAGKRKVHILIFSSIVWKLVFILVNTDARSLTFRSSIKRQVETFPHSNHLQTHPPSSSFQDTRRAEEKNKHNQILYYTAVICLVACLCSAFFVLE